MTAENRKQALETLNEMIIDYLSKKLKKEMISSFEAEPDNSRIEFYMIKNDLALTVCAICIEDRKILEIYPITREMSQELSKSLSALCSLLGFQVILRK